MIKCTNPKAIARPACWVTQQKCVHDCSVDTGNLLWFKNNLNPGESDYVCSLCGKNILDSEPRTTVSHHSENLEARFHMDCFLTAREDGKI
jgi:hypothetical protein